MSCGVQQTACAGVSEKGLNRRLAQGFRRRNEAGDYKRGA